MSRPVDGEPFALQKTLDGLRLPLSDQSRQALRAQVFEYVDALKTAGRPPEQVILAVKKLAFDAGFQTTSHIVYSDKLYGPDALIAELVAWCIERFYGEKA
ncbi:MAG TPA: hypothetical protein VI259_17040 [Gemmatimonadaceae bacterium]